MIRKRLKAVRRSQRLLNQTSGKNNPIIVSETDTKLSDAQQNISTSSNVAPHSVGNSTNILRGSNRKHHILNNTENIQAYPEDILNAATKNCSDFVNTKVSRQEKNSTDCDEEKENVLPAGEKTIIGRRNPSYINITKFSVSDQHGHLCLISSLDVHDCDGAIYVSGYLKSDFHNLDKESELVKDVGPILKWSIQKLNAETRLHVIISTEFQEYILLQPSVEYTPLMNIFYEKIRLSEIVINYLRQYYDLNPNYDDLLKVITKSSISELTEQKITEDMLLNNAQFVCDQVENLEENEKVKFRKLPCIKQLVKQKNINLEKLKTKENEHDKKTKNKREFTKATTTPLVRKTFESLFPNQMDKINDEVKGRCGICKACQLPDCGECDYCQDMPKFGGEGLLKKACAHKVCPALSEHQIDDSDTETDDDEEYPQMFENNFIEEDDCIPVQVKEISRKIKWIGEPVKIDANKCYYNKVELDDARLQIGDYVTVATRLPFIPTLVAKIVYMWKDTYNPTSGYFHAQVYMRSCDTVLGELGNPQEVFLIDKCCNNVPFSSIIRKVSVTRKNTPEDWFQLGGRDVNDELFEDDGKTYFFKKSYMRFTGRFEDLPNDPFCPSDLRKYRYCPSCERQINREFKVIPSVFRTFSENTPKASEGFRTELTSVQWQDYEYKKGCSVFLKPRTFKLSNSFKYSDNSSNIKNSKLLKKSSQQKFKNVDEDVYPEYYRKSENNSLGSNIRTKEPFCVGYIVAVTARVYSWLIDPQDIYLKVNIMYRPENTSCRFPQREDLNVVYWSDEIVEVPFSTVIGPCDLFYEKNIPDQESIQMWLEKNPNRFYFSKAYDISSKKFVNVPLHATRVGQIENIKRVKGKGKGKSSKPVAQRASAENAQTRPLRTLDVFAGCGGLSDGLHRAGVAECKWAIENFDAAADAYSLNHSKCQVFYEDCNSVLNNVLMGATHSAGGLRLPKQGEVELLCGGPPCQGFSGMNRFNSSDYSNFKNSLIASFLSFCDYYRPKYFILENVRNFVTFKRGMVLKLTIRSLLDMGYQCAFGVLQAGNFGIPQTRRRLIIFAAAPGYKLPSFPKPTHVFSGHMTSLATRIDGKFFVSDVQWERSAPRRTCTILDALGDLPEIESGANKLEIDYGSMPQSYFQRMVRGADESARLCDHICKNMNPLIQARICHVPTTPGSDWRDLPNISVTLSDGSKSKVLQYRYEDQKNGRSSTDALRGVCACAAGGDCSPADRQLGTLIPWCLPHTANRHNNWAGLYGRLSWEGFFSTTVTDPEPMGKQGRVLHPDQPRVVSVRECARSQGFRDSYRFAGTLQDKHRQIGNAVPPPLSEALGRELMKALLASKIHT